MVSDISSDELDNYDPTTPLRPTAASSRQPEAGPSQPSKSRRSKEVAKVGKRTTTRDRPPTARKGIDSSLRRPRNIPEVPKVTKAKSPEVTMVSDDEVVEEPKPASKSTRRGGGAGGAVNGVGMSGAAKEKRRAQEQVVVENEAMEVESVELLEEVPEQPVAKKPKRSTKSNLSTAPVVSETAGRSEEIDEMKREIERLKNRVDEVTSQRDKLSKQLEELFHIRHTEPEEALEAQAKQYEARLEIQENLLKEQGKLIEASAKGPPHMLHFLSREAADEEKKELEKEVAKWKEVVRQRDLALLKKDDKIKDLETQYNQVDKDLQAEVARSKTLMARNPPPSVSRNKGMPEDTPQKASAIRLYEDVTNLLIVGVRFEKGEFQGVRDDEIFDCVYTMPTSVQAEFSTRSIHFLLRTHYERDPDVGPDAPLDKQLVPKVLYQPRDLDKERPEFLDRLDFFGASFGFVYDQLHVFLKTLVDKVTNETPGSQGEPEEPDELVEDN